MRKRPFVIVCLLIVFASICALNIERKHSKFLYRVSGDSRQTWVDKGTVSEEKQTALSTGEMHLPASLVTIEDEAFEGTGIVTVQIPRSVKEIGDKVFAESEHLKEVRFLGSPDRIGNNFVSDDHEVTIRMFFGSSVQAWANRHGYRTNFLSAVTRKKEKRPAIGFGLSATDRVETEQQGESCLAEKKERRTGRKTGELKSCQYKGISSIYIQSRYFP